MSTVLNSKLTFCNQFFERMFRNWPTRDTFCDFKTENCQIESLVLEIAKNKICSRNGVARKDNNKKLIRNSGGSIGLHVAATLLGRSQDIGCEFANHDTIILDTFIHNRSRSRVTAPAIPAWNPWQMRDTIKCEPRRACAKAESTLIKLRMCTILQKKPRDRRKQHFLIISFVCFHFIIFKIGKVIWHLVVCLFFCLHSWFFKVALHFYVPLCQIFF